MPKFHNISVDFKYKDIATRPYIKGGLDVSLSCCGTAVTVDATGYRNEFSGVEIHIADSLCLVLDGEQATNLLECLNKALNSEQGKDNIIRIIGE